MPQRYLIRFIGWRMKAPAAGAPTGRMAPSARRPRPAPRSPAPRTPAPPRRVPVTAPRVPPAARRPRASHTPTTTHALATPIFRRFWPRPAILRHDPGLAASPPLRYTLKMERIGLLSLYRPRWADKPFAKRRRAAYGGTAGPGGSPLGPRMQPRNEKFLHRIDGPSYRPRAHQAHADAPRGHCCVGTEDDRPGG